MRLVRTRAAAIRGEIEKRISLENRLFRGGL
jgi:hypothetical protein